MSRNKDGEIKTETMDRRTAPQNAGPTCVEETGKEDERYYIDCPLRKNKGKTPIVKCFGCEFATGYTFDHWAGVGKAHVEIGCGFPVSTRSKKTRRTRPEVKRIERDGLS